MLDISLNALTALTQIVMGLVVVNPMHTGDPIDLHEELYCLAINSYHEARGASFDDKIATAQVVMNRVASMKYPEDVCEVITEGPVRESWKTKQYPDLDYGDRVFYPVKHRCQFSWYCDGRSDAVYNLDGWEDSVIAAFLVYTGFGEDIVDGATHYYAHDKVNPSWAKSMTVTVKLKGHTYLRED
jgi:spore germination cell wall hydrolase CwlJ-like protein|tara:strand:- start:230 stop:784 length:555 start_codon:yes stop_codon:yes gene_type:complete